MSDRSPVGPFEIRGYYEREAELRSRRAVTGRRVELRNRFLELLARERRSSVLDAGAGPGLDGAAFAAAGHRIVGVDLARGNGRLAAEVGVPVAQGSVLALPVRSLAFDAGWSFSTLMHLEAPEVVTAVDELARALVPGAPAMIGLWGRERPTSVIDDAHGPRRRRPFHLRPLARNRELLSAGGDVEWVERFDAVADDSDYHVFLLRTRSG